MPSFRHFQDRFLTTSKEKRGKETGLSFARSVFDVLRAVRFTQFESVSESNDTMRLRTNRTIRVFEITIAIEALIARSSALSSLDVLWEVGVCEFPSRVALNLVVYNVNV